MMLFWQSRVTLSASISTFPNRVAVRVRLEVILQNRHIAKELGAKRTTHANAARHAESSIQRRARATNSTDEFMATSFRASADRPHSEHENQPAPHHVALGPIASPEQS